MSRDMLKEEVPRLNRRTGDNVLASSNNSTILLGRDRVDTIDSGYGSDVGAGSIHLTAGRKTEDPSVANDAATLYVSQKTDPDIIAGKMPGTAQTAKSGLVGRADCIRMSARQDMKISVGSAYLTITSDGKIVIEGDISLGESAAQSIIRGDAFSAFWNTVRVPTPVGLSGPLPPIPPTIFTTRSRVK